MDVEFSKRDNWLIVDIHQRLDTFNYEKVIKKITDELAKSKDFSLMLNLTQVHFLNLASIKYFSHIRQEGMHIVLISPSEKLKRQMDIFVSLDGFEIYESFKDWEKEFFPKAPMQSTTIESAHANVPST